MISHRPISGKIEVQFLNTAHYEMEEQVQGGSTTSVSKVCKRK